MTHRVPHVEIKKSAWSALYTNAAIPSEKPAKKGGITVKAMNHYRNEVLKVYEVK